MTHVTTDEYENLCENKRQANPGMGSPKGRDILTVSNPFFPAAALMKSMTNDKPMTATKVDQKYPHRFRIVPKEIHGEQLFDRNCMKFMFYRARTRHVLCFCVFPIARVTHGQREEKGKKGDDTAWH